MDSQWLAKCRDGEPLAIERLVQTHQQDVYRLAISILDDPDEADDATQEVFISALRGLDSFRANSSFKTWLFSITINVCRSRLRRGKSRARLSQILQSLIHGEQAFPERRRRDPESEVIQNETGSKLWQAIQALDEKHRIPIILRYYHDLPVNDIAEMLGIPDGTVHSRLNHARGRLRGQLKDE